MDDLGNCDNPYVKNIGDGCSVLLILNFQRLVKGTRNVIR